MLKYFGLKYLCSEKYKFLFIIVTKTFPKAGKESFQKVTLVHFFVIMFLASRATLNSVLYDNDRINQGNDGKKYF